MDLIWLKALILFVIPGITWFAVSRKTVKSPILFVSNVFGISASIYIILVLSTFVFRYKLTESKILFFWSVLVVVTIFQFARKYKNSNYISTPTPNKKEIIWQLFALIIFIGILALRFYQIRELVLPAWVDSLHHVLLVHIFLEKLQIPLDLNPYIDVPFYYHFGFHSITALVAYLTHLPPEKAVLYFGQILNAFVPVALFTLAKSIWGDTKRAITTLILVGFVFQMPAYYVTWGRYTLLTGVIFLALSMAVAFEIYHFGGSVERQLRLALFAAGTILSHYLAGILLAIFFFAMALDVMLFRKPSLIQVLKPKRFSALLLSGIISLIITLPWLIHVLSLSNNYINLEFNPLDGNLSQIASNEYNQYIWYLLGPKRSHILAVLGAVALLMVGWRKNIRPFALWAMIFILVSLPWGVQLKPFRPDHGVILAFFPASLLVSDFIIIPIEAKTKKWFHWTAVILSIMFLVLFTIWGIKETRNIINPVTNFVSQSDMDAIAWIKDNIPPNSKFFINITPWQYKIYRGVDGGWWIHVLTENKTILPPIIFGFGTENIVKKTNELSKNANAFNACDEGFEKFLRANNLNYIYLKEGTGNITPEIMNECAWSIQVFNKYNVFIYKIIP